MVFSVIGRYSARALRILPGGVVKQLNNLECFGEAMAAIAFRRKWGLAVALVTTLANIANADWYFPPGTKCKILVDGTSSYTINGTFTFHPYIIKDGKLVEDKNALVAGGAAMVTYQDTLK